MRMIYCDPPYIGQAKKHYAKEATADGRVAAEVDHAALLEDITNNYDGWALSLSSVSLITIARLVGRDGNFALPWDARIGAWVKPFASFKPGVNPAYCWEPVLFQPGRALGKEVPTVRDFLSANITLKRGVSGAKPDTFCYWLFDLLGMQPDDEFVDQFPGSGAVSRAWDKWRNQGRLIA